VRRGGDGGERESKICKNGEQALSPEEKESVPKKEICREVLIHDG
jgi:hypothetical protein